MTVRAHASKRLALVAPYSYRADPAVPDFPDDKALIVFDGVCVDHLIGSAMRSSIRLVVSIEIDAASGDPTGYR